MKERYTEEGSAPRTEEPLSVSELVGRLAQVVQSGFPSVFVEGELSNLRRPASGHLYFTIKDAQSSIRCVLWRSAAAGVRFRPVDGMQVRVRGGLTVYPSRGDVQLTVQTMMPAGEGDRRRALAALYRRLRAEGLFDPARKQTLPRHPRVIGLITSDSGAAVRDVTSVLERRYPLARVVLAGVTVQGEGAADEVVRALRAFNSLGTRDPQRPDVLILTRGGGSLEDLWAFNEEPTVRAVHASGIPVICGVGHETDTTLCDLAADARAATPSMAAELAVPDRRELLQSVTTLAARHGGLVTTRMERARHLLERASGVRRFGHPRTRLEQASQGLDEATLALSEGIGRKLREARLGADARLESWRLLDPLRPLESGFALATHDGHPVTSADGVPYDSPFSLRFRDGRVTAIRTRNE